MIICGYDIKHGEKKEVDICVPNGVPIKAVLFCGEKEGKTLIVTAGVHGCEYVGVEAVSWLCQNIDPKNLCGNLILVPIVNTSGFFAGAKQIVPEDNINLNRAFPGDEKGSISKRIAYAIEKNIYPYGDFLIDLHSGDINESLFPLVFFPAIGEENINRKSLEAAKALSVPYRVKSTAKNGLYSWAVQKGIPSLLLERGCGGLWTEDEVSKSINDVYRIMQYLKIIDGEYKSINQTEITEAVYEEAKENGFWYPDVKAGQVIKKGSVLGVLRSYSDGKETEITAQFDGIVLYFTTSLGVRDGEALVAYGKP